MSEGRCRLSIFDDVKGKAEGLVNKHGDAIKRGVEKSGDWVDGKTGDKYKDQIDSAQKATSDYVDGSAKADGQPNVDGSAK